MERSNDLRAELNRRRAGEDARISLERVRERRQNVEGRNLDCDFATVAPQTPTGARIQAGVSLAGSSPRGNLAIQVPATPAREVRWYDKSVKILAGLRHHHYGSRWRHHRNGDILPCCLVWASPNLAHEPCQRLSAAWRGGPSPRSEAGAWRNSPGVYLPLHQGTRHYSSYFRCFHHHRFPPGSA
jgi:hypothetical protein